MLAKRPESVSLNWSLQSRAKRAIKKKFYRWDQFNKKIRIKEYLFFTNQEKFLPLS
jgi:hypothetical protein